MMTRASAPNSRPNILLMNREHLPAEIEATKAEILAARQLTAELEDSLSTLSALAAVMKMTDKPRPEVSPTLTASEGESA